jgi:poly(hydroxyalkanoate) depolymerase family esterase
MPGRQRIDQRVAVWTSIVCAMLAAAGSAGAAALPGTPFSGTFANASGARSYLGYVPSTYAPGVAMPLVVALHGCTQTADALRRLTELDRLAEARGFVVVFPEQSPGANPLRCWNWFAPAHMQRGSGEPSLIAGITRSVEQRVTVDPRRIYVAGLSAGGAMAAVMGATYPDLYAAIGVGSGCEYAGLPCSVLGGPDPRLAGRLAYRAMGARARTMPVVVFQGDRDQVVAPINAEQLVQQWLATGDWADDGAYDGSIPTTPTSRTTSRAPGRRSSTVTTYPDGHGAELVQSWLVHGMGHAWSGGCSCEPFADPSGPSESRVMVEFFLRHAMP